MIDDPSILQQLMTVIENRKRNRPSKSYTTKLLDGGVDAIGAKVLEEAAELVEASREVEAAKLVDNRLHKALTYEAADLIYHLLVMLAHGGITWAEVETELARRFGISGLDEKASRKRSSRK